MHELIMKRYKVSPDLRVMEQPASMIGQAKSQLWATTRSVVDGCLRGFGKLIKVMTTRPSCEDKEPIVKDIKTGGLSLSTFRSTVTGCFSGVFLGALETIFESEEEECNDRD